MPKPSLRLPCLGVVLLAVAGSEASTQPRDPQSTNPSAVALPDPRGRPGEAHKVLDAYVGDWNLEMKLWFSPGAEPTIASATSHVEWVLGRRFIEERVTGTLIDQPYESLSITGYNGSAKRYEATRYSSLNTATLPEHGTFAEATRTLTFVSILRLADGSALEQRTVTTQKHLDQHVWEVFHKGPDGNERKAIELVYTRRR